MADLEVSTLSPILFFPPHDFNNLRCAKTTTQLVTNCRENYKNVIALYIMSSKSYYHFFRSHIACVWKSSGNCQIFSKDNGFYLIKFESREDCEKILAHGPYFYDKRLIIMKNGKHGMKLTKEFLQLITIQVRLSGLEQDY